MPQYTLLVQSEVRSAPFFRKLGYSSVWEDERILADGLAPRPEDRVFSITSGGCHSLHFLLFDVAEVVSLDFNPAQTALLAFKSAALAALEPAALWESLGLRPSTRRTDLYGAIRPHLPPEFRSYWDHESAVVARGPGLAGTQDRFLFTAGRAIRVAQGAGTVRRWLSCKTQAEQRAFFDDRWSTPLWRSLCGVLFSRFVLDRAFDPAHFRYSREDHPARRMRKGIDHVFRDVPAWDNFYVHYAFRRTYPSTELCPAWLRRGSQAVLRVRADRIRLETGEFESFIRKTPPNSFDCFHFSNIFDWVSEPVFHGLMREIVRVARPGARLCYWANVLNPLRRPSLPEVRELPEIGQRIFANARTPGYSGCVVARIEKG